MQTSKEFLLLNAVKRQFVAYTPETTKALLKLLYSSGSSYLHKSCINEQLDCKA